MNPKYMQYFVNDLEETRGFTEEPIDVKLDCLDQEIIEFKDALKGNGDPAEEGIDVINLVLMIFNRLGIDFEEAFYVKYKKDRAR